MPLDTVINATATPLRVINARDLLAIDPDKVWDVVAVGKFRLMFDDGFIDTYSRPTIMSSYAWWSHREHPESPLLIKHHLGNGAITSAQLSNLFGVCAWSVYHATGGLTDPEEMGLRIRVEMNKMRDTNVKRLAAYVSTMSAEDIVDILDHPEIAAANREIQSIDYSDPMNRINAARHVDKAHGIIRRVLMDPNELRGNRMVRAIKAKMIDIQQILQCVGPRGLVTDYDSMLFAIPVVRGFGEGLMDLYSLAVESRSATKSLMLTKDPLADTEYFNREMQLICATVERLYHNTDCGSTEYTPWLVTRNNLDVLDGLFHAEDGKLKMIRPSSTELLGKVVLLRTALTCKHPDANGICSTCFGHLSVNVPRKTNIGHVSSTEMCSRVSQGVLSTKHNDLITGIAGGIMSPYNARFLQVTDNMFELGLSPQLTGLSVHLVIAKEDILNLADINLATNLDSLTPNKVSAMSEVTFDITYEDGDVESNVVFVSTGSRRASFTTQFLTFMKMNGWETTNNLDIRIDLSNWNRDLPIWELPRKHADMMEFMGSVETLVKVSGSSKAKRAMDLSVYGNLALALSEFHDLVSQKFAINITHLAVILRATMIRSSADNDYRLPTADSPREFAGFKQIMAMRSLSAMCAYQEQSGMFKNFLSFLVKKRAPHPFDTILMPEDF